MFSMLFKCVQNFLEDQALAKARKQQEDEARLQHLVRELMKPDKEDDIENQANLDEQKNQPVEAETDAGSYCVKTEGVITELNNFGGTINEKHKFLKITAKRSFNNLRLGSKVSFLLFEGSVRSIEILEPDWDEKATDAIVIPDNAKSVEYTTDCRTVIGKITKIEEEIITVDNGNNQEILIPLEKHPDIKYFFVEGDILRIDCVIQEDANSWNPSIASFGNILDVKSFQPNREKHEIGRVSAMFEDYAIIDEAVIASFSLIKEASSLSFSKEYEYKAIETNCMVDGREYPWRVIEIIKCIECDADRAIKSDDSVQMQDATFEMRVDHFKEITQFVTVYNNSPEAITLKSSSLTSKSGLVRLDRPELNQELHPNTGKYKIFLKVKPKQGGIFVEDLLVDFGTFKKKCLVTLQIQNESRPNGSKPLQKQENSHELIPGKRVREAPRFIDIRIKDYSVPEKLRLIDFKKQTQLVMQDDLMERYSFLFQEVTKENYVAKLRYCLYLEEIAMEIHFTRYKIERGHFENKQEFLRLEIQGVAERRPSLSIGDSIRVKNAFSKSKYDSVYEGCIHKIEQNAILVKFHPDFHQSHNRKDFRIDFHFSRGTFKRQQHALDKAVSYVGLGFDFLFPLKRSQPKNPQVDVTVASNGNMIINRKEFPWFNERLNEYQKEAVVNVLRGVRRPLPYIIYGPPGTGKTQTVIECIEQIADKMPWSRIIVATPSNSAANLIVDRLIACGRFRGGDFVRFVSFNQIEKDLIPEHLKKYCATIDIAYDDGKAHNLTSMDSGLRLNCSKSIIVQYKIYISTLSSLGPLMQIKFPHDHFTHVIIDEAGQSIETESLIPISFVSRNKGQVILAGDPKQLGPVLVSQIGKLCGFDKSFLERLSEHDYYMPYHGPNNDAYDSEFVTKLKKNYRSLPSILEIYNELSYSGELEAEVSEENSPEMALLTSVDEILWNRATADRKCGAYFINVSNGKNQRTVDSCSWFNNEEASRIFFFVCKLKKKGISMSDIGIITPYALQVKNLKRIINESMPGCDLKVGSVEEFQGQERQIILVSTVRTNSSLLQSDYHFGLGFLQCEKRMNVAISRARSLLVVFGKESILARDPNWRFLIKYCKEKGTYVSI